MKVQVLVVDDSRAMRMMLSNMLTEMGFEVSQAQHGREGLEHLTGHPDTAIALVDWNMPVMTGLEMVEAVRQDSSLNRVKLMMVTTESEMSQMELALNAGANEYVLKPFTKDVIKDKLKLLRVGA
jgi:two-component system, chemotaxis family, chemotaxis protein CheY